MLSHVLCVQLSLFILFRPLCHASTLHPAMCLASNRSCLLPGKEQEHADSERQGPHVHQEVGAWQAEQTQDPGQHQEEVHQWRVRCFPYIMHCWCLWRICFFFKLPHCSSFREIRSKSHEETRQFQENFEVKWFLFPYFRSKICNSLWQNIYINCAGVHANLDLSMSGLELPHWDLLWRRWIAWALAVSQR